MVVHMYEIAGYPYVLRLKVTLILLQHCTYYVQMVVRMYEVAGYTYVLRLKVTLILLQHCTYVQMVVHMYKIGCTYVQNRRLSMS